MSLLSKIADGYESGAYEWIRYDHGDSKSDIAAHPERTPEFCPIGAIFALGSTCFDRTDAARRLNAEAGAMGYPLFQRYNDTPWRTLDQVLDVLRAADARLTE